MLKQIQCLTTFGSSTIWMHLKSDRLTGLGTDSPCLLSVLVQLPSTASPGTDLQGQGMSVSKSTQSWGSLLRQPTKMLINPIYSGGWKHHALIWPMHQKMSYFHKLCCCKISYVAVNESNKDKDTVHGRISLPWAGYFQDIPHPSS